MIKIRNRFLDRTKSCVPGDNFAESQQWCHRNPEGWDCVAVTFEGFTWSLMSLLSPFIAIYKKTALFLLWQTQKVNNM